MKRRGAGADAEVQVAATESLSRRHPLLIVAETRVAALGAALRRPLSVAGSLSGTDLAGLECAHPLSGRHVPLLFGDHVTDDAGTGLVHTAPGHGPEDYVVGQAHGLEAACPVDELGRFTHETAEATPFAGLEVLSDGNSAVLDALKASGVLLACDRQYVHRYPYDWRSKTPVIFRTTPQWFAQLGRLREPALAALDDVAMTPPAGRARLEAFLRGRTEWCLSRQRSWGVPIPAFYHVETGEALLTDETVRVRQLVAERGSSCWWELDEAELLPPSTSPTRPAGARGPTPSTCGSTREPRGARCLASETAGARPVLTFIWKALISTAAGSSRRCSHTAARMRRAARRTPPS